MGVVIDRACRQPFRGRIPRDNQGNTCRFAVRTLAGPVVYATTLPEALSAVMDEGYERLGPEDRRRARRAYAVAVAERVQARLLVDVTAEQRVCDVLCSPKGTAITVEEWDHAVPLVLVDSWFAPYGSVPAPTGRVMWVRAEDEWLFAMSLMDAGEADVVARG